MQPHTPGKSGPLAASKEASLLVRVADLCPFSPLWVKSLNSLGDPGSLDPHPGASLTSHPSAGQEAGVAPADPTLRAHCTLTSLLLQGLSPGACPSLTSEPVAGLILHQKTLILDGGRGESGLRVMIKGSRVAEGRAFICRGGGMGDGEHFRGHC